MEKPFELLKQEIDGLHNSGASYDERISRLEQTVNHLQSHITSLNAAVERALSSLLPKEESLLTEGRVASEASSDEAAPSTSTREASLVSNPRLTSVTEAAAAGDAVALRRILANGGSANARDSSGVPALHLAASRGHAEAVGALLEGGAHVDVESTGQRTALHEATQKGHVDVVRRLLEAGSEVEVEDSEGITPLMLAVKAKHWQIVRLLVERGADSNTRIFEGLSALMVAAAEGDIETVAVMLRHKKPDKVYEALSYAKNASVVRAFEKALPRVVGSDGGDAMREAAEQGRLESMVALLDAGVAIDCKNRVGSTALMYASFKEECQVECVKELVRRGALLDECNEYGDTALHWASYDGNEEVVRVLLDAGADRNKRNKNGRTALDISDTEAIRNILMILPTHSICTVS